MRTAWAKHKIVFHALFSLAAALHFSTSLFAQDKHQQQQQQHQHQISQAPVCPTTLEAISRGGTVHDPARYTATPTEPQTLQWPLPPEDYQNIPFLNFAAELADQSEDYRRRGVPVEAHTRVPAYVPPVSSGVVRPTDAQIQSIAESSKLYDTIFGTGFKAFAWSGIESANPKSKDDEYRWDLLRDTGMYDATVRANLISKLKTLGISNLRLGIPNHLIDLKDSNSWKPLDAIVNDFARAGIKMSLDLHHFGIEDQFKVVGANGETIPEKSYYLNDRWPDYFADFSLAVYERYHDRVHAFTIINEPETTVAFNSEFWHGAQPRWSSKDNDLFYIRRALRIAQAAVKAREKIEDYVAKHPAERRPLFIHNEALNWKKRDPVFNGIVRYLPSDLILGHDWLMSLDLDALSKLSLSGLAERSVKIPEGQYDAFDWMYRGFIRSQPKEAQEARRQELFKELKNLQALHRHLPFPMSRFTVWGADYYTFSEAGYGIPEEHHGDLLSPLPQHYAQQVREGRRRGLHASLVDYFNHNPMTTMIAETGTPFPEHGEKFLAQVSLDIAQAAREGIPIKGKTEYPAKDTGGWRTTLSTNPDKGEKDSVAPGGLIDEHGNPRPYALNFLAKMQRRMERPPIVHTGIVHGPDLEQLTGTHLKPGQEIFPQDPQETPDVAPPYWNLDGSVDLHVSAQYYLHYETRAAFRAAGEFTIIPFVMRYPNGVPIKGTYIHDWDPIRYRVISPGKAPYEILLGGGMSPSNGRPTALWPDDNEGRRVFMYHQLEDKSWIRNMDPIVGDTHHYGGNLFQLRNDNPNVIYTNKPIYYYTERVTIENGRHITSSVVYELDSNFKVIKGPINVMRPDDPMTERSIFNGRLIEGGRPFEAKLGNGKTNIVVGGSPSDFCTNCYTMNFAFAHHPLGPYEMMKEADGRWKKYGEDLKQTRKLSWMGRPVIYTDPDTGETLLMFHAVRKELLAADYTKWAHADAPYQLWEFHRSIFRVKIKIVELPNGKIDIEFLKGSNAVQETPDGSFQSAEPTRTH